MDLQSLTEAEFMALIDEVARERDRRAVLATTQQVVEQAMAAYYEAAGGDGREWRQPLGAHDAYPLGAVVTYEGGSFRSLIAANVWPPMTSGLWEIVSAPTPSEPIEWAPEWAPGEQVVAGAVRTYGGDRFVAVQGHTTQTGWEPPHVPALWGRA